MSYCRHRDCKLWVKEADIYCKEHDEQFRDRLAKAKEKMRSEGKDT